MDERRMHGLGRRGRVLALAVALAAAGCTAEPEARPTPPPVPAGWITVDRPSADLFITLPPWLVPFDTRTAIFANEVVDPGAQGVQLMAEGPRTAEPQPAAGEPVEQWLLARIESPAAGQPTIRQVDLPAGAAVVVERLDAAGTGFAWRIAAYGIRTPYGVAFLQIDGPPDSWIGREDELAQIPWLIQVGPGRPG